MESVHGVDVSWLHHSHKDRHSRVSPPSDIPGDAIPPISKQAETIVSSEEAPETNGTTTSNPPQDLSSPPTPAKNIPTTPTHPTTSNQLQTSLSNAQVKKKVTNEGPLTHHPKPATPRKDSGNSKRRNSWMSKLSSGFTSPNPTIAILPPASKEAKEQSHSTKDRASPQLELSNPFGAAYSPGTKDMERKDASSPYVPSPPKNPSFLQNALRRLSSSGPSNLGKVSGTGSICERKVMNVDPNRDRVKVEEFNQAKLRRVSFSVDVEIAGFARYLEPEPEEQKAASPTGRRPSLQMLEMQANLKKSKEKKMREKGEGAALRNPQAAVDSKSRKESDPFAWDAEKDEATEAATEAAKEAAENVAREKGQEQDSSPPETNGEDMPNGEDHVPKPTDIDGKAPTRKKEKKKRTEEERKARKERKRREAEVNGKIPLELMRDETDWDSTPAVTPPGATTPTHSSNQPTTNPLRIYRRCCQLRETPVLKKIADQISSPSPTLVDALGTVACLDLSNFPIAPSDLNTLADWLAVVPVRRLILENCGLTDETMRIILAGVLAVKTSVQSRFNRQLTKNRTVPQEEKLGVIEKLSLKNNDKIGVEGWRHIGLFMHLSRSLRSIDVSGIPFPPEPPAGHLGGQDSEKKDVCVVISKGLAKRYGGNHLEELIMGECKLSSHHIGQLIDGAIKCGLRRFGLASNRIDEEGMKHIAKYLKSGHCEGLDLGGNKINDHLHLIGDSLDENNPLLTLSLADCGLNPTTLAKLMPTFTQLPNFRFIDLSHNHELFASQPDALPMLRRFLPQLAFLKRIHLSDVDLTPDHAIALAEILPECNSLCHLSITENSRLAKLTQSADPASQEEACAMFAALMSAVRVSQTIIAVEIEVPGPESSEVVKALAKQVVAYSLRNMERGPWTDTYLNAGAPVIDPETRENLEVAPDILLQIVGHMEGYSDDHDHDPPAADVDYVTAGTGVVKALGVCLGTAEYGSRNISPTGSGTATPQRISKPDRSRKAKNMSKNLLDSARKIRARLQPALIREDQAGNEMNYRRLQFLDQTLQRVITRFEEEYPETRILSSESVPGENEFDDSASIISSATADEQTSDPLSPSSTTEDQAPASDEEAMPAKIARHSSDTSLQAHALDIEEGRMHRLGQNLRRDILRPQTLDHAHGTTGQEVEGAHLTVLREKLDVLGGDELREKINRDGFEQALQSIGASAKELMALERDDPEGFEIFKQSQIAATTNAGDRLPETNKLIMRENGDGNRELAGRAVGK